MVENPYASPQSMACGPISLADPSQRPVIPYESGHASALRFMVLLGIMLMFDGIVAGEYGVQLELLRRAQRGDSPPLTQLQKHERRQHTLARWELLLFAATAGVFLMWGHRIQRNLPSLGLARPQWRSCWSTLSIAIRTSSASTSTVCRATGGR